MVHLPVAELAADQLRAAVLGYADELALALDSRDWSGPDPYDALLGPLGRLAHSKLPRQVLIQMTKRSRVDLRPILRIPEVRTAAATGMGAAACARLAADPRWRHRAEHLATLTLSARLDGEYGGLWGYEFDVQTRWGYYPEGEPNMVATTFAVDGCLSMRALGAEHLERLGRGLLHHLSIAEHFTYTPTSHVLIHNANLMGASVAFRVAEQAGVAPALAEELRSAAHRAVEATLARQRPDGSWPYGEGRGLEWVDGFHTGYVLLRLAEVVGHGPSVWCDALRRGASFYFGNLFDDVRPLYSLQNPHRRDGNNAATALRTAVWGAREGYVDARFPARVGQRLLDDGWFAAMLRPRRRWAGDALPSPRWLGAPLLDALTAWHEWLADA